MITGAGETPLAFGPGAMAVVTLYLLGMVGIGWIARK